jgi:hypothetical protein
MLQISTPGSEQLEATLRKSEVRLNMRAALSVLPITQGPLLAESRLKREYRVAQLLARMTNTGRMRANPDEVMVTHQETG